MLEFREVPEYEKFETETYSCLYLDDIIFHNDDLNLPIFRSGAAKPKSTKEIATASLQHPPSLKVCTPTHSNIRWQKFRIYSWHFTFTSLERCTIRYDIWFSSLSSLSYLLQTGTIWNKLKELTMTTGVSDIPTTTMIVPIFIKLLWQFT